MTYHLGKRNRTAHCLSTLPLPTSCDAEEEPELIAAILAARTALSVSEFSAACETRSELCLLRAQIGKGWPNSRKAVAPELASYFAVHHEQCICVASDLLIVQLPLRNKVVNLAHESHRAIVRTKERLHYLYWWPQMESLVQSITSSCVSCQLSNKTAKTFPVRQQPVDCLRDHGRRWQ